MKICTQENSVQVQWSDKPASFKSMVWWISMAVLSAPLFLLAQPIKADSTWLENVSELRPLFDLALQNNPSIAQSQAMQQQADYALQQADAELGPQLNFNAELSYAAMAKKDFARSANQLVATYPLYEPQKQDGKKSAEFQLQSKQFALSAQKQKVLMQVAALYMRYWQQQEGVRYLQKEQTAIENIMKQLQQRFQVGLQDLNDIAEIQSRLDFNQAELLKAQADLQQTRASLLSTLGLQSLRELKIYLADHGGSELLNDAGQLGKNMALFDLQQLKQLLLSSQDASNDLQQQAFWWQAVQTHPGLHAVQAQQSVSQQQEQAIEKRYGPKVQAFGALVYNESDKNFYDDMRGARAGVRLNVPLYLSGLDSASIAQQRQQTESIQAQKRQMALQLQAQAYNAWLAIDSGFKRYQALKQALSSSQQALKASEQALKTGRRNVLDLLDAQRHLHRMQRDLPQLEAQIWLNYYQLLSATGRLG